MSHQGETNNGDKADISTSTTTHKSIVISDAVEINQSELEHSRDSMLIFISCMWIGERGLKRPKDGSRVMVNAHTFTEV